MKSKVLGTTITTLLESEARFLKEEFKIVNTFTSKENDSDTKEHVLPIKGEVIDFCIDDTAIKNDTIEK